MVAYHRRARQAPARDAQRRPATSSASSSPLRVTLATLHPLAMPPLATLAPPHMLHHSPRYTSLPHRPVVPFLCATHVEASLALRPEHTHWSEEPPANRYPPPESARGPWAPDRLRGIPRDERVELRIGALQPLPLLLHCELVGLGLLVQLVRVHLVLTLIMPMPMSLRGCTASFVLMAWPWPSTRLFTALWSFPSCLSMVVWLCGTVYWSAAFALPSTLPDACAVRPLLP